jgi:hypothetical protein
VHGLLDRATRPLLDLLGVRKTPSGPGRLLDRLRALAKSDRAPAHEVEKWYRRLDQMLDGCSTADAQNIRNAFKTEKLILAQDGTWATASGVFLAGRRGGCSRRGGRARFRARSQPVASHRRRRSTLGRLALQWLEPWPREGAVG